MENLSQKRFDPDMDCSSFNEMKEQQLQLDNMLAKVMRERLKLKKTQRKEQDEALPPRILKHYSYILPLVKEIYLLQLKIKEQTEVYEAKKWKSEAAAFGEALFSAALKEEECVLKRWSNELTSSSDGMSQVTNISYSARHTDGALREMLGFTVLSQGVHVGVEVRAETTCQSIHFLGSGAKVFGIRSDTFIPGLEEKARLVLSNAGPVTDVVSMVTKYIQEDMAPYVIVIPTKKKSKGKKARVKEKETVENETLKTVNQSSANTNKWQ